MATVNAVGNSLTGASGTGNFAGTTSPTFTTPNLGAATATSIAFSSTSEIIGTTTNNNAAAGSVGEFISATIASGSAVAVTSNTALDITSVSLTAGDWDVWGVIYYKPDVGTQVSVVYSSCSTTTASVDTTVGRFANQTYGNQVVQTYDPQTTIICPTSRFSLSGTTTVYLVGLSVFTISTMTAYGGIFARRRR